MNSKNNPNFLTFSQQFPRVLTIIFCIIGFFMSTPSFAQRIINSSNGNGSFENDALYTPRLTNLTANYDILNDSNVPSWNSTTNLIEVWKTGFKNVPAQTGDYFIELNARGPGMNYQNMCLTNGEVIRWDFWHRARAGGSQNAVYQEVNLDIATPGGSIIQTLVTHTLRRPRKNKQGKWYQVQNTTGSAFSGMTGIHRVGFDSITGGSYGNFLDNVKIKFATYIEFASDTTTIAEDGSSGTMPSIVVYGTLDTAVTVPITITGGTATPGTDFTPASGATITIPTGTYDGVSPSSVIPVPYTVATDAINDNNETIIFGFGTPLSSNKVMVANSGCGTARTASTVTITDVAPTIVANDDTPPAVTSAGATIPNVVANDTLNGNPAVIGTDVDLTSTGVANDGTTQLGLGASPAAGGIVMNADGTVTVAPNTTLGTYAYIYEICEIGVTPANCDTATVTIVVNAIDLIAEIEEDLTAILQEDLANTLTLQMEQISGYSSDALARLQERSREKTQRTPRTCLTDVNARLKQENIRFANDKAIIRRASNPLLDELATILKSCSGSAFEIAGHTDSNASDEYNLNLSKRRVVAVLQALANRGVNTKGFTTQGYGESQPIADNATSMGRSLNRRVEFRPIASEVVTKSIFTFCEDTNSFTHNVQGKANDNSANGDAKFVSDSYNCYKDTRDVISGSISFIDTDQGQAQGRIDLSYRREYYEGDDSVFGYFIGAYGSKTNVDNLATGDIRGVGVNGGVYGANHLKSDLYVDYYLGASAGKHSFDLDFKRNIGTIIAAGDYTYLAGFAGAAISGSYELEDTVVTPRVGFDYVYSPGANVDVVAEFGNLSQAGNLKLDSISGGRVFAEVRTDFALQKDVGFWITPRIACYRSMGSIDNVCGYGGSVGVENQDDDNSKISYFAELTGEGGSGYAMGDFTIGIKRRLSIGSVKLDTNVDSAGNVNVGTELQVDVD